MAIWQFDLNLIPDRDARVAGMPAVRLSQDQLIAANLRLPQVETEQLCAWLADLLPERASWSREMRIWGEDDTDAVHVAFEGKEAAQVQFRLHAAAVSLSFVSGMCDIACRLDCLLAVPGGAIIQPRPEAVLRAIGLSDAARFVGDPAGFLAKA